MSEKTMKLLQDATELNDIRKRLKEINLEMDHLIGMQRDLVKEADKLYERVQKINPDD